MNDKTPPAWAIQAAREIENNRDKKKRYTSKFITPDWVFDEQAEIISQYAPDAEALVVLLSEYLRVFDDPRNSNREVKQWLDSDWIPSVRDALRQYRARFPQSQETR